MSAAEPKKAAETTSQTFSEVFDEAMRSYEKALKAGIQLQCERCFANERAPGWQQLGIVALGGSPGKIEPAPTARDHSHRSRGLQDSR